MKYALLLILALSTTGIVDHAIAASLNPGLEPGDSVEWFPVEKVGGAVNDEVQVGEHLCYRCKLGGRPVVMVFARTVNPALSNLVKQLDRQMTEHAAQKLGSFVNLLGTDFEALKVEGKKFAAQNRLENVAVVVPEDQKAGPDEYKINPDADLTVIVYREGIVHANHAYRAGEFDAKGLETILSDTAKILAEQEAANSE